MAKTQFDSRNMKYWNNPKKVEEIVSWFVTTTYIWEATPWTATDPTVAADSEARWKIMRVTEDSSTWLTKFEYPRVIWKDPAWAWYSWSARATYTYSFD